MKFNFLILLVATLLALPSARAGDKKAEAAPAVLKLHPKIFSFVEGWLSDGESPIVTEINLDAAEISRNQFNTDEIKQADGWIQSSGRDGMGFLRFKVLESKAHRYKIEYQENGGGSLTTASIIEFSIDKRDILKDGKNTTIHVLRVLSYASKS